jgi:hypothetical protein
VLNFKSPLEVLQAKSPDLSLLKVFGCFCFMHFPPSQCDKLDSRSNKCIFLGYSQTQKEYKGYNPSLNKMYTLRDVRFIKDIPYFFTTSRREDYFELFPLLSSSFINQSPCSLQRQSTNAKTNSSSDNPTSKSSSAGDIQRVNLISNENPYDKATGKRFNYDQVL